MRRRLTPAGSKRNKPTKREEKHLKKEEITLLLDQLQAEERTERVWKQMTAEDNGDNEAFDDIEQHLLAQPQDDARRFRRWKFFGK